MVFGGHIAFGVGLIALVAGTFLLVRTGGEGACCKGFAKVVGIFVVALSILCILCTAYHSFRYWEEGYFMTPMKGPMMKGGEMMRGPHMMGPGMMEKRKR